MRRFVLAILLLFVALSVCSLSNAQQIAPRKWSQLPDMEWGFDVYSTIMPYGYSSNVADDWLCTNGLPITDIHWWGSYGDWSMDARPENTITGFQIDIFGYYAPYPFYIPHARYNLTIEEGNETYCGLQEYTGHSAFEYSIILDEPFNQEEGSTYWLMIAAYLEDGTSYEWGWKTTDPDSRYGCGAVKYTGDSWEWIPIEYSDYVDPSHPYYDYGPVNMAFELTTIPEPAAIIMLGSLATGLFGIAGIKRKR